MCSLLDMFGRKTAKYYTQVMQAGPLLDMLGVLGKLI